MPDQKAKRRSKRPNKSPARDRYWSTNRLRDHKVRNIVRSTGMDPLDARILWTDQRQGRMRRTR